MMAHYTLTVSSCEVGKRVVALLLRHDVAHDGDVVREGGDPESLDDHIAQVVRIQHQVLPAVA